MSEKPECELITDQPMSFEDWGVEMANLIKTSGIYDEYEPDAWRPYWESGFTPKDALDEDLSYADDGQ